MRDDLSPHSLLSTSSAVFVGRQREMALLQTHLESASSGQGCLAMLVGEAGIGKTRAAREFAGSARQQGVMVLSGSSLEGDWQPPYGPWVEALGEYARTTDPDLLRRQIGPGLAPLAQLVPALRAAVPDVPPPALLSPDEERLRLFDAVIQLLLTLSQRQPVLLVLDDLHWADRDSLRLLRHVARFADRARLLILGVYREPEPGLQPGHPLVDLLGMLRRETDYHQMALTGLSSEEMAEYLAASAGQSLPQALIRTMYNTTNGNPFYVREVFRHLVEEGKLLYRDGRWATDVSLGELGIPDGVRHVLAHRLAHISDPTGTMLRVAAGFTGPFGLSILQALTALPEEALLDCIDEALQSGLLRVADGISPKYEFAHAIVRQTIYEELNPDRRTRLHRQIARALVEVYAGREEAHAAELAAQYHASLSLAEAGTGVRWALEAAEQASIQFAHEGTVRFLRMARDLAGQSEPGVKADVLCRLALAEAEALLLEEASRTVGEALAALSTADAYPRQRVEFLTTVARLLKDSGAPPAVWEPLMEEGLRLVREQRDLPWARLELLRDRIELVPSGPIRVARWLGLDPEAVAIARAEGDEEDYVRTLYPYATRSRQETEDILALARTWHQPAAILRSLQLAGWDLYTQHGAYRESAACYDELLTLSERYGSLVGQAEALYILALTHVQAGEFSAAQQTLQRARERIARVGPAHPLLSVYEASLVIPLTYYLDWDWQPIADMARTVIGSDLLGPRRGLWMLAMTAFICARAGNREESRQFLGELTPLAERESPTAFDQNSLVNMAATAVWDLQAVDLAATCRRLALDLIAVNPGPGPSGPIELDVAHMAALLGDAAEAEEYFARARVETERIGQRHVRGIVDYDEALFLIRADSPDHGRIAALLDAALARFRELGMEGWAARAQSLQEKLSPPLPSSSAERQMYPDGLTERQVAILRLLAFGKSNREIAAELVLSVATVERHVANIYAKLGVRGRAEATAHALRRGLVEPTS
ncbi:MAG: helix-turn-helix transcriptional regulator [Chloroflexota bacterium]|nr:MAG: helix-turn-helix transcriptional regulator [Chloroflexota bacterium]